MESDKLQNVIDDDSYETTDDVTRGVALDVAGIDFNGLPVLTKPAVRACRPEEFVGLPPKCPEDPMYVYPLTSIDLFTDDHQSTANSVVRFLKEMFEDSDITIKQQKFKIAVDVFDAWGQMASISILMFYLSDKEMRVSFRCDKGSHDVFMDVYERCRAYLMGEGTPSTCAELLDSMPALDMSEVGMPSVEELGFEVDMVADYNESVKCEGLAVLSDCGDVGAQAVLAREGIMGKLLAEESTCVVLAACRLLEQCESDICKQMLESEEVVPAVLEALLNSERLSARANKLTNTLKSLLLLGDNLAAQCDIHSLEDASSIFLADDRVCQALDQCASICTF